MTDAIPFVDGEYLMEQAVFIGPTRSAARLLHPVLEVVTGRLGKRLVKGRGLMRPFLLVELMEDSEAIDLLIDMGQAFKFLARNPSIKAGKVFAPEVSAIVQFSLTTDWEPVSESGFKRQLDGLALLPD
jgi:hypothetical protein